MYVQVKNEQEYNIQLSRKSGNGLGFSIAGGRESIPFKDDDDGIFISRIVSNGIADTAGLQVGDKVLSINGVPCLNISHFKAANLLRNTGKNIYLRIARQVLRVVPSANVYSNSPQPMFMYPVSETNRYSSMYQVPNHPAAIPVIPYIPNYNYLDIPRSPSVPYLHPAIERHQSMSYYDSSMFRSIPSNLHTAIKAEELGRRYSTKSTYSPELVEVFRQVVHLDRQNGGFGFIITSREDPANETNAVYVSRIIKGGPADQNGQLGVGDRLIQINNINVENVRHEDAVMLLTGNEPSVRLVVERDPQSAREMETSGTDLDIPQDLLEIPWKLSGPNTRKLAEEEKQSTSAAEYPGRQTITNSTSDLDPPGSQIDNKSYEQEFPSVPTELGVTKETVTKQTLTETIITRITNNQLGKPPVITEDVLLKKIDDRIGLRIVGGKGTSCVPFGGNERGIFISSIIADGAADRTNRLRVGDRLLKINGRDVSEATHQQAVAFLSDNDAQIILTVRHDPPPEGLLEITILKKEFEKFGMRIIGGLLPNGTHPSGNKDCGIFISHIDSDGIINSDGRLKVGMRLLEVNGTNLVGVTRKQAVDTLRGCGSLLQLLVCDGATRMKCQPSVISLDKIESTEQQDQQDYLSQQPSNLETTAATLGSPVSDTAKKTTIVMSKHTIQPQVKLPN